MENRRRERGPTRLRFAARAGTLLRMSETPQPPPDWDSRYAAPGWAFGEEPNDFLRAEASRIPARGRVLCLAEGQGRNAVFLATLGHDVTAMDQSRVGMERAAALAASRGVTIRTQVADLASYAIEPGAWDAIVSIYAHVSSDIRRPLYRAVAAGLKPGGIFLLEAYTPQQMGRGTGGPPEADRMMTAAGLRSELPGLEWEIARELERDVQEGVRHTGLSHVVQVAGRKPGGR
jgi:SAM-dependent methyltransferase